MVIKSAILGGQARDLLEETSNLDLCLRQTNIRAQLPELGYTRKILEASWSHAPKPGTFIPGITANPRQLPQIRGNVVGPRVDFWRVGPSCLL